MTIILSFLIIIISVTYRDTDNSFDLMYFFQFLGKQETILIQKNKIHAGSRVQDFDRFYNFQIMWKYGNRSSSKFIRKKKKTFSKFRYHRPSLLVFLVPYLSLLSSMITKFNSDDSEVDLSPLFWYWFTFSMFAVFSSNPNFNDSFGFHPLRFIVWTFVCRYSLRVRLLRMIYKEIFRLRLIRIRDLIFLKFKRYIFWVQNLLRFFWASKS